MTHRRQPTRLPRPWDSPSKNTGVGCHFLLQCMKVKSESEVTQWCLALRDPMVCSLPGSSVHGIFQARVLEWGAIPFSGQGSLFGAKSDRAAHQLPGQTGQLTWLYTWQSCWPDFLLRCCLALSRCSGMVSQSSGTGVSLSSMQGCELASLPGQGSRTSFKAGKQDLLVEIPNQAELCTKPPHQIAGVAL